MTDDFDVELTDDRELKLSDLAHQICENLGDQLESFHLVMDEVKVYGRRHKHRIEFKYRIRAVIDGKVYTLVEIEDQHCHEGKRLTFELPRRAMEISVG